MEIHLYVMNKLTPATRATVLTLLYEGNSLRATSRIAGVALDTVTKRMSLLPSPRPTWPGTFGLGPRWTPTTS